LKYHNREWVNNKDLKMCCECTHFIDGEKFCKMDLETKPEAVYCEQFIDKE